MSMIWFKLHTDMPNNPAIRQVLIELGVEGFGGLVLLMCFIGHAGKGLPGQAIDSKHTPFPKNVLQHASGLDTKKFDALVEILFEAHSLDQEAWTERGEMFLVGMTNYGKKYAEKGQQLATEPPQKAKQLPAAPVDQNRVGGKVTTQRLMETWNTETKGHCEAVRKVTDIRVAACSNAVKKHGIAELEHAMAMIPTSPFLTGAKGWKATFNWLMKGDNCVNVNEGQYAGRAAPVGKEGLFAQNRKELDAFVEGAITRETPLLTGDK